MKITSIEPTPSPHSMKVNIDETLPDGENKNIQHGDDLTDAPDYIQNLFAIDGIKGIYQVQDFITLQRHPRTRWEDILPEVRIVLGSVEEQINDIQTDTAQIDDHFGEITVFIQMFRHIPMQIKLQDGVKEERFGLPDYFSDAVMKASEASGNMLMERKWVEQSPRYGDMQEIGKDVVEEIKATYDKDREIGRASCRERV